MKKLTRVQVLIRETFLNLVEEKGFYNITVKNILDNANISKSGFYAHYEDKYHLLKTIEDELFEEMRDAFRKVRAQSSGRPLNHKNVTNAEDYFALYFKCLEKNEDLFKLLLGNHGDRDFVYKLTDLIATEQTITRELWGTRETIASEFLDYYTTSLTWAYVGTFIKWLNADTDTRPSAEQMGVALATYFTAMAD